MLIPHSAASMSTIKSKEGSGCYGNTHEMVLQLLNACVASSVHLNTFTFRREVRGVDTGLKFLVNFLKKFAKPRNLCSSLVDLGCSHAVTASTLILYISSPGSCKVYPRKLTVG